MHIEDGATTTELRSERDLLNELIGELESGKLRNIENGVDVSSQLIVEWTASLAHIDRVIADRHSSAK
jgi:hypothetical protein